MKCLTAFLTECLRPAWRLLLLLPLTPAVSAEAALYQFTILGPPGVTRLNGGLPSLPGPITITGIGDTANVIFGPNQTFPPLTVITLQLDRLLFSGPGVSGEFADPGIFQRTQGTPNQVGVTMGGTVLAPFTEPSFGSWNWLNPTPMVWFGDGNVRRDTRGPFELASGDLLDYSYVDEPSAVNFTLVAQPVVPEPSTIALWIGGLIAAGMAQRRTRKNQPMRS